MKITDRVAVVIPAYNEALFLSYCLDALEAQTLPPNAVYVVDNNSTDDSARIASSYSFVTVLKEPVQGICAATKRGMDEAGLTSDIILRCDADSRPNSDWIEKTMNAFHSSRDIDAVTGPGVFYDTSKWKAAFFYVTYMLPYFLSVGLAVGRVPLFGSNMAIRADVWREMSNKTHLANRQDLHDDIDMTYHLPETTHVKFDAGLRMPISARPFRTFRGMKKRYAAGMATMKAHWPEHSPYAAYRKKAKELLTTANGK